jgi:hypothetical protein
MKKFSVKRGRQEFTYTWEMSICGNSQATFEGEFAFPSVISHFSEAIEICA